MLLKEALIYLLKNPELTGFFLVTLRGQGNPDTFLKYFYQRIKKSHDVTMLDCSEYSLNDCRAQLEMSFLGSRKLFVLKNIASLDAAHKKIWLGYLARYAGPHGLFFFESLGRTVSGVQPAASAEQLIIELPESCDPRLYKELFTFFFPEAAYDPTFVKTLYGRESSVGLDDACRMMSYQLVVGRNSDLFFKSWYPKVVVPETSLFSLSQALLGRNSQQFFTQWKACKDDYPVEFWVVYWSDQVWQATHFIRRVQFHGHAEAKKGYYKLPFKFLDRDWQRYSPQLLIKAHNELYELDYALKNGADEFGLELWYHRFLTAG